MELTLLSALILTVCLVAMALIYVFYPQKPQPTATERLDNSMKTLIENVNKFKDFMPACQRLKIGPSHGKSITAESLKECYKSALQEPNLTAEDQLMIAIAANTIREHKKLDLPLFTGI